MSPDLENVRVLRLPAEALVHFADLRTRQDLRVLIDNEFAWLRFESASQAIVERALAIPNAELFARREERWHRLGRQLPVENIPLQQITQPLHRVLSPAAFTPVPPASRAFHKQPIRLVHSDTPRETTALLCRQPELAAWADSVSGARLAHFLAAHCDGDILLRGKHLPWFPQSRRLWGSRSLLPLGRRPQPNVPERVLCELYGIGADEILMLLDESAEIIPRSAFAPLTRAGIRRVVDALACAQVRELRSAIR